MRILLKTIPLFLLIVFFIFVDSVHNNAVAESNAKRGGRIYKSYCSPCHGQKGDGRGPRARNELLQPPPRDHTNGFYMNMQPDVRFFKVIKFGGKANNLSHIMPQWKHILSDKEIFHVIAFIRTLADPPYEVPKSRNWDKNPYAVGDYKEAGEQLDAVKDKEKPEKQDKIPGDKE